MKRIWLRMLLIFTVGMVVGGGVSGCSVLQKLGHGLRGESNAPSQSVGRSFLFEIGRDWKRRHPEYTREYGIIYYYDYNGSGMPGLSEIVNIIPADYPISEIDLSRPYNPRGEELWNQREQEEDLRDQRQREKERAIKSVLDSISDPYTRKIGDETLSHKRSPENETLQDRRNKAKDRAIKSLLDDTRKDGPQ